MTVLVSACLLGENCKYNGGNNASPAILEFLKDKQVIPICPELLAGMPSPRPPVEIKDARVIRKNGEDVTDAYCSCVQKAMQRAAQQPIDLVILKSRSPTWRWSAIRRHIYQHLGAAIRPVCRGAAASRLHRQKL